MKMPEQLPPVQRTGNVAVVSQPSVPQSLAMPEASRSLGSGVSPSQGPDACNGLQGEAQQLCLSMFT
jgi:hypothetical protein